MARRRSPESYAAISPGVVEIESLLSGLVSRDWRSIAIRTATKEYVSTLSSVLRVPGQPNDPTASEEELLRLIPRLLTEAVRQQHRDVITEAIGRLAVGCQIDLLPLLQAAVEDLRAISQLPQLNREEHRALDL